MKKNLEIFGTPKNKKPKNKRIRRKVFRSIPSTGIARIIHFDETETRLREFLGFIEEKNFDPGIGLVNSH